MANNAASTGRGAGAVEAAQSQITKAMARHLARPLLRKRSRKSQLFPLKRLNEWELDLADEEQLLLEQLRCENLKISAIAKAKVLADLEGLPEGDKEKLRLLLQYDGLLFGRHGANKYQ